MFSTCHKARPVETRNWGGGADKWSDSARQYEWVVTTHSQGYHTVTELHMEGRWLASPCTGLASQHQEIKS